MPSYSKFESDNKKYSKNRSVHNPEFNKTVDMKGQQQIDGFIKNLDKWSDFVSWCR